MTEVPRTLIDGAIAVHEMYLSYVKAGFTEDQAMQLVVGWIQATFLQRNS